jgi:hypothetical protein
MKSIRFLLLFTLIASIQLDAQPIYKYSDIFFLDSTNGWILGTQNYLWKTTDAGSTWTSIYDPRIDSWGKLFFINEQKGWMLLDTILYYSSNGETVGLLSLNFLNQSAWQIFLLSTILLDLLEV